MTAAAVAEIERAAEGISYLNLGQFARVVGSTEPTVRQRVDEAADGPWLIERGGKGREYRIHPVLGPEWWRAQEADRRAEEDLKDAAIEQLRMSFLGEHALGDPEQQALSPAEQLKLLEVQKALRIEARERGALLDRQVIAGRLNQVMTLFSKRILAAAKRAAKDAELGHAQRAEWEEAVEGAINSVIDDCQELLRADA